MQIEIKLSSILVSDQADALRFYCDILGFVKKTDIPLGDFRWLTVVSPHQPDGTELVLEPTAFPPAATYQQALFEAGIPITAFAVSDLTHEYERISQLGGVFRGPPTPPSSEEGDVVTALLEDTCGNLLQLYQA